MIARSHNVAVFGYRRISCKIPPLLSIPPLYLHMCKYYFFQIFPQLGGGMCKYFLYVKVLFLRPMCKYFFFLRPVYRYIFSWKIVVFQAYLSKISPAALILWPPAADLERLRRVCKEKKSNNLAKKNQKKYLEKTFFILCSTFTRFSETYFCHVQVLMLNTNYNEHKSVFRKN